MKIKLIATKLSGDTEYPGVAVRMNESPSDYYAMDSTGAVLGICGITYQRNAGGVFHYALSHDNNPEYVISSATRFLTISFQDGIGDTIPLADFALGLQLMFKISYPDQPNQIQEQYSAEIHRGI